MQISKTGKVETLLDLSDVRIQVRSSLCLVLVGLGRIRQCVGEKNYKYFVSFLGLHSVWCLYLSMIGTSSLIEYLERISFWEMAFSINGQKVLADPIIALQVLVHIFSSYS